MKCIRCQHDSKYKDRSGGVCPNCKGQFAFEPKDGAPFTDGAFSHAIEAVSGQGTVRFLPQHVRWQLERQKQPGRRVTLVIGVVVAAFGAMGSGFVTLVTGEVELGALLLVPVVIVAAALVITGRARMHTAQLSDASFRTMWSRWVHVHGTPKGTIERKAQKAPRTAALDAELEQYSFDRAVICDRPELVDVLLQNRFHFENNCAVLSFGGYPEGAFTIVRKMLKNNPKLLILAVHDASPDGCRMAHQLATDPAWFKDHGRVVDVGLRPVHAKFFPGQIERNEPPASVDADAAISPVEAKWLRAYRLDALAIRPEQLVKRLYRALTDAEKRVDGDAAVATGGSDGGVLYLGVDSDTVDGGADSFG